MWRQWVVRKHDQADDSSLDFPLHTPLRLSVKMGFNKITDKITDKITRKKGEVVSHVHLSSVTVSVRRSHHAGRVRSNPPKRSPETSEKLPKTKTSTARQRPLNPHLHIPFASP